MSLQNSGRNRQQASTHPGSQLNRPRSSQSTNPDRRDISHGSTSRLGNINVAQPIIRASNASGKPCAASNGDLKRRQQEAREPQIALATKRRDMQIRALKGLPLSTLFIMLYVRNEPSIPNDFHWGLYHHTDVFGGTKYHITNGKRGWIAAHGRTNGALHGNSLSCLVPIAVNPPASDQRVDQIARRYDNTLNTIANINSRTWVLMVVRDLIAADLVHCRSLTELEQECLAAGNLHANGREQPRPQVRPRSCT